MWRIYKEGQGRWARGLVVSVLFIASLYGVAFLYQSLPESFFGFRELGVMGWNFDWRFFICGPLLILLAGCGVRLFNHPPAADFLIDTEHELKNKVVWPSKEEEINASLVVVTAVFIFMVFILGVDVVFSFVREMVYNESPPAPPI